MKLFFLFFACVFVSLFAGISNPSYETFQARTMGNAFVAVASGKDALHYNVAGLNKIHSWGNQTFDLVGTFEFADLSFFSYEIGNSPFINLFNVLDELENAEGGNVLSDTTFNETISSIDRLPAIFLGQSELGFAIHNFGVSGTILGRAYLYFDQGLIVPEFGVYYSFLDVAVQSGVAWEIQDQLSLGVGIRVIHRQETKNIRVQLEDGGRELVRNARDSSRSVQGIGIDFGGIWQITENLALGASLQNVFLRLGSPVIPEFTFGGSYRPQFLQNTKGPFQRSLILAVDWENTFISEKAFFDHLNVGVEYKQVIVPLLLQVRLATGFNNNFNSTFGFGLEFISIVRWEFGTWTEDLTILDEELQRVYSAELAFDF